jgi:hypothetical protein
MIKYEELKMGTKVRLINQDGWGRLRVGVVYEVTNLWDVCITLDGIPVSMVFAEDFEVVE